ncbi:MAG: plastocyanin/azurin family copper-binding protein [Microcoleaceae cyanobacterium]
MMNRVKQLIKTFCNFKGLKPLILVIGLFLGFNLINSAVWADSNPLIGDLSRQSPTEIRVSLGNVDNELKFVPSHIEFETGKRYKLILTNPSNQKHYFTAKDFMDVSWTQKVEFGKVEIKGAIHEVELKPGGELAWVIIPIRTGTYPLRCSIPGHSEAGMVGDITIKTS